MIYKFIFCQNFNPVGLGKVIKSCFHFNEKSYHIEEAGGSYKMEYVAIWLQKKEFR